MATETVNINTFITVTQSGHGFSAGNVLYRASGSYSLAKADAIGTSKVVGVVASVTNANTFTLALPGHKINGLSGFTDGNVLYLSESTAGAFQTAIPLSPSLAVPVAVAVSATSIIVGNILGQLVFDPLTQDRPDHTPGDMSFHYFSVYDTGEARSEKADGIAVKAWLAGEFDALGAAAAALVSANAHSDALVVGLFDDRGNWDASGNLWPATGGSGTAGAVLKGDVWRVSVAGTLGGELADVGDSFRALVDTPGQTASNWALFAANTQQATESVRGTAAIATQAEAEDSASTNDIDIVTPKKWWQAFTVGVTFATAPAALLTSIRSTLLTGLSLASSAAVAATDSILEAFGKLQAFNNLFTTAGLAIARLANPGAETFLRINADNTATARSASEMRTDLGLGTAALLVGVAGAEAAYTGTPTFTAGAAPSGASSLRQFYTQVGNHVEFQISLTYATTGTTVTNVTLTFPTEFPTPAIPTGFTGANAKIAPMTGRTITTPTGTTASIVPTLVRNAGDTAFEIQCVAFTSGSYRSFIFSGSYFTA